MNWILLLNAGCAPQDAVISGSYHTWLAANSSATVDEGELKLGNATHLDCTTDDPEERAIGAECAWLDEEVVNPNNEATSPEFYRFIESDEYFLKEGKLNPWRSEALITAEGDFQLTFHHDLGNGQDYRVAMVIDPEFQPTTCVQSGATCYALDGEQTDDDGDGWVDDLDPDCFVGAWEVGFNADYECNDGHDNDGDGNVDSADADCIHPWATENLACSDNEDNDADGWTDQHDFDCVDHGNEDGATNDTYVCSNGLDDDGDGDTDADDDGCESNLDADEGGPTDSDPCRDDVDNDGDGWVDGDDIDCDYFETEAGWTPFACNDGLDNDGDTFTDADDADCWMPTRMTEETGDGTCVDGEDNDGDGWEDEEDPDCILGTAEDDTFFGTWACNDGIDNDAEGDEDPADTDAKDSDCKSAMQGTEESGASNNCEADGDEDGDGWENSADLDCMLSNKEKGYLGLVCNDGLDNDGDTLVDADDLDCLSPWRNSEDLIDPTSDCSDGVDNDADGWIDVEDGGCLMGDFEADVVTDCSDGVDNDTVADGLVDVDDTDCAWSLDSSEESDDLCDDQLDNDGDGWTDGADPDCGTDGYEVGFTEGACNDGQENDGDGNTDADDDGCDSALDPFESVLDECADGEDNDGDSWTDQADPDCSLLGSSVEGGQLGALTQCSDGLDNDGDGNADASDSDCEDALDNVESAQDAGDPVALKLDQGDVVDEWSADEDGHSIYYLNAGAYQLNPADQDDYWNLPQEWLSGFAHSKFAAEEFAVLPNEFFYLGTDPRNPDADGYQDAANEVRDAAFGWQAELQTFGAMDWDGYELKVEDNAWRKVDLVEAGLDNWAEVHASYVRIKDGSDLTVGGHAKGDFQVYLVGYEAASLMVVQGSFDIAELREEKWAYSSLEDELREVNNTPLCE